MINIGVIGYGYWGPNLARNVLQNKNCKLKGVCDLRNDRLEIFKNNIPGVNTFTNYNDLITDPLIDALIIATPLINHYEISIKCLDAGKHVLVEKPLTDNIAKAEKLIEIALKNNLILMVDHIFVYNGVIKKIKELIDNNNLGQLFYIDSTRINLGIFQNDNNVVLDLATHDISIINYLISEKPYSVIATGKSHTLNNIENIAYITLNYNSNLIVHIHCSWLSPVKIRQMLIGGSNKMLIYNDIEPTEKLKIYDYNLIMHKEDEKHKILIDYRTGDVNIPKYDTNEPLANLIEDFCNAITNMNQPIVNPTNFLEVIKIISATNNSLKLKGKEVIIN